MASQYLFGTGLVLMSCSFSNESVQFYNGPIEFQMVSCLLKHSTKNMRVA